MLIAKFKVSSDRLSFCFVSSLRRHVIVAVYPKFPFCTLNSSVNHWPTFQKCPAIKGIKWRRTISLTTSWVDVLLIRFRCHRCLHWNAHTRSNLMLSQSLQIQKWRSFHCDPEAKEQTQQVDSWWVHQWRQQCGVTFSGKNFFNTCQSLCWPSSGISGNSDYIFHN